MDSIFALAQSGYAALLVIDPSLSQTGDTFLSNAARVVDRTVMPRDQVKELQLSIAAFLRQISKYLLEIPTSKVIEWLVRRFRYA